VGLDRSLWAGSVAAIQRLLVQEDATAAGVVCDESGWLAESGDTCIICGNPTRKTDDVLDELAEAVIDSGGTVEHVVADTPLRDHVAAADLRYPLPPKPGDEA
jgi:peptide chain release factor subunit 1